MDKNLPEILSQLSPSADRRINIEFVESELMKQEQLSCPVVHSFGPGIYTREVRLPAGGIAIGHHQNFEHVNLFLKGKVSMVNDDGSVTVLTAPMQFVGKPGRKIGFIHEDVVWLNIYATNETDVEKLEAHYLTKSDSWKLSVESRNSIKLIQHDADVKDYQDVLKEFGFTEKIAREQSENKSDMTELPFGSYKIKVGSSSIEGQGLIATADIVAGEIIAPARIGDKRTIAGRFTNHSVNPNARMIEGILGGIFLISNREISGCHGGLDGEEITINYRDALTLNYEIAKAELCRE